MLKVIDKYSLDLLSKICQDTTLSPNGPPRRVELGGIQVKTNSWRYYNFLEHGFKCVCCGKEATYLALEVSVSSKGVLDETMIRNGALLGHLNAYLNEKDHRLLFTKDHIWPASLGGKDCLENFQTMCKKCNNARGAKLLITLDQAIERNLIKEGYIEKVRKGLECGEIELLPSLSCLLSPSS